MKTLRERWMDVVQKLLEPWTAVLSLVNILLVIAVVVTTEQPAFVRMLLALLSAAVAGGLGYLLGRESVQASVDRALAGRGATAVRTLRLLQKRIESLDTRLQGFLTHQEADGGSPELVRRDYREAIAVCGDLRADVSSFLEDWIESLPKAETQTPAPVVPTQPAPPAPASTTEIASSS